MVMTHLMTHGLFYGVFATGYLFLIMITISPRVWGYHDYPDNIKKKVPAQTKKEKTLAWIVGLPWLIFVPGFPVFSTFALKAKLGGEISFSTAVLNALVLFFVATLGDLVLLDWIIVSKITPKFVIIPGTVKEDYKDFSHHYKAHAKATVPIILLCLIIAGIVSFL
jgi:hypothetical protein